MGCGCRNKTRLNVDSPEDTLPDEPCVYCAEKHLSAAMQMANECGYERPNRQRIIGELTLAQWHIYRTDYRAAEMMRDIRHLVQRREEASVTTQMWSAVCARIDDAVNAALKADAGANVNG